MGWFDYPKEKPKKPDNPSKVPVGDGALGKAKKAIRSRQQQIEDQINEASGYTPKKAGYHKGGLVKKKGCR
jgi:hypothetical protein